MTSIANIVYQKTMSEGTGALTLSAVTGYRSFYAAFGTGGNDMFFYALRHLVLDEWEVGTGHLADAATLVRDTIIASSNGGAAVHFSAGDKDVVNDIPAERQLPLPAAPQTGDLLRYDGSQWARLPRGSTGQMLKSHADNISWATPALADISGLQSALDTKSTAGHSHTSSDITDFAAQLATKANTSHAHAVSDVTGLDASLSGKADAAHGHAITDITDLSATLAGKANTTHSHIVGDVTGLQSALNSKADTSHTHTAAEITDLSTTLAAYTPMARQITTDTGSLSGGGDLSVDRSLQLTGDAATPGNNKYYGTNDSGDKGFHTLPAGAAAAEVTADTSAHRLITGSTVQEALTAADAALLCGGFSPTHLAAFHHLAGSLGGSIFAAVVSGSGANAATVDTDYIRNTDAMGVIRLSSGSPATGCALRGLGSTQLVVHEDGKTLQLVSRVQLDTLIATGSHEFFVWGGLTAGTAATTNPDTTVGVYWIYDKTSANWQLRRHLSSSTDTVDTGIPVAVDTWYDMALTVTGDSSQSSVDMTLSINGVAVATLDTLPAFVSYNAVAAAIQRKLGTGARYLYLDYEGLFIGRDT
jgi:hypothetical protein